MYRGSQPTSAADRPFSPPSTMLANMNRLPSIPSHPAHVPHHGSAPPYQRSSAAPSPPDISSQHHRPRDFQGGQSHAQQLPSLRTLLEPELLENKPSDHITRPSGTHLLHGTAGRYGSASPTLKRRHDFDSYSHNDTESHAIASRIPPVHRHAQHSASTDSQPATLSTSGSAHGPQRSGLSRHSSSSGTIQADPTTKIFRPQSTTSEPVSAHSGYVPLHDDAMDLGKPMRRRTEGSARAPIRSKHCVGQQELPGEGLCYVFDDGSYCRVVIDGEPVNPSWGVTKAGKPRKRLAQACLTCREKKIKCEPGYPKCHQCAKSQRSCRG